MKKDNEKPDVTIFRFRSLISASRVGLLRGLVAQGGSFILIPRLTSYVKIPTRIALGSNLSIILISSFAGFIGTATTGQIK